MRSTVERRRNDGWCIYCGEHYPEEGKAGCTACLRKRAKDARDRDRANQKKGKCRCGGDRFKGRFQCKKCLTKRATAWNGFKLRRTAEAITSLGQRTENLSERLNVASAKANDPKLSEWSEILAGVAKIIMELPSAILEHASNHTDGKL